MLRVPEDELPTCWPFAALLPASAEFACLQHLLINLAYSKALLSVCFLESLFKFLNLRGALSLSVVVLRAAGCKLIGNRPEVAFAAIYEDFLNFLARKGGIQFVGKPSFPLRA